MIKITVNMVAWNEEKTVDLALKSIIDFADEIIFVDNGSTDKTVEIAEEIKKEYDLNMRIFKKERILLADSRWFAIKKSTGKWICIVDADQALYDRSFVLPLHPVQVKFYPTRGSIAISTKDLRKLVEKNPNVNAYYACKYVQLYGDLRHLLRQQPFSPAHVFLFKNDSKVSRATHRWSLPQIDYKRIFQKTICGVNMGGVKPSLRLYLRQYFHPWQRACDPTKGRTEHKADKYYGNPLEYVIGTTGKNIEELKLEADKWAIQELQEKCLDIKYIFMDGINSLPSVVKKELQNPRYKLKYKDGEIIGRRPDL